MTEHAPQGEADVARDTGIARSRAHGGPLADAEVSDAATTTGTVDHGLFVGRVAGDDLGYAGQTGAEARADDESSTSDSGGSGSKDTGPSGGR